MIEVEDLTKYYGGKRAIHDLCFRIEKGEIVGFLGLNGAGKTTTLRIFARHTASVRRNVGARLLALRR